MGHNRKTDTMQTMSVLELQSKLSLELLPADGCGTATMATDHFFEAPDMTRKVVKQHTEEEEIFFV